MNGGPDVASELEANRSIRHVGLLSIASVVSGVVVGGIGGRIVMGFSAAAAGPEMVGRLTENGNRIGQFTIGGTAALIVFGGVFVGLAGVIFVVASDPWLRWLGPIQGMGFAIAALAAGGESLFSGLDFRILDPASLNVAMFLGLHVAFGFGVSGFYWLLNRTLPPATEQEQAGYRLANGLATLSFLLVMAFFTLESFCECDPAYELGAITLLMVASTIVRNASKVGGTLPPWSGPIATITGYASLTVLLVVGLS